MPQIFSEGMIPLKKISGLSEWPWREQLKVVDETPAEHRDYVDYF